MLASIGVDSIADLIEYRQQRERLVERLAAVYGVSVRRSDSPDPLRA